MSYLCIRKRNKQQIKPKSRKGTTKMKAFIDITPKSHKNGQIYINDQVQNMNDCYAWFELNMDYLKKVAKRKSIEYVKLYVKEQYNVIYEFTI